MFFINRLTYAAEDDNQTIQFQTVDIEVDENGWRIYDKQDYFEYKLYQDDDGVTKAAITGLLVPDDRVGLAHCVYIPDTIDDYVVGRIEAKCIL